MEIKVSKAGTYYLRAFALDSFDGRVWHRATHTDIIGESASQMMPFYIAERHNEAFSRGGADAVSMVIKHINESNIAHYIPYYSAEQQTDAFDEYEILLYHNAGKSVSELAAEL